jgi:hypothetical protein
MSKSKAVRVGNLRVDYGPQDPPMFDWSDFLEDADKIIERVGKPKHRPRADKKPGKGKSLAHLRTEIAMLLARTRECYCIELEDFDERNDTVKQSRSRAPEHLNTEEYSHSTDQVFLDNILSEPLQEFAPEDLWDYHYKSKRQNPGKSHTNGLPIPPLHTVFTMVRAWWGKKNLGNFYPIFADGDDERLHNASSRFLLAVIQSNNADYTVPNARGLYETIRKSESRKRGVGHRSSPK